MTIQYKKIYYKAGYKYQLNQSYFDHLKIKPPHHIETEWITLGTNGSLYIRAGYAWDGPSGLTFDTKSSMRASLVHDALYELMRRGRLAQSYRDDADYALYERCIEDKMYKWRARAWLRAVQIGAGPAADPDNKKKVHEAP